LIVWCLTPALAVFQLYRGVAQNIAGAKEDPNEYDWSLFPFFSKFGSWFRSFDIAG